MSLSYLFFIFKSICKVEGKNFSAHLRKLGNKVITCLQKILFIMGIHCHGNTCVTTQIIIILLILISLFFTVVIWAVTYTYYFM